MYITFKLVNYGEGDYPEDMKCFSTLEEAKKYAESTDENVTIEEADLIGGDFEIYKYLDITYKPGEEPSIKFKTTTSIDKDKDNINSIQSYGDRVYIDAFINNSRDAYRKIPKILDALDMLFLNAREDEESKIHHKLGITDINKDEFFEMIK